MRRICITHGNGILSKTPIFTFFLISGLCGLPSFLPANEMGAAAKSRPSIAFQNASPEMVAEADKIIEAVVQRFEEVTHKSVGTLSIQVNFVDVLGVEKSSKLIERTGQFWGSRPQGEMYRDGELSSIEISNKRTSSWGRIFAHELTHALTRGVFGEVYNHTLDEGLAEYIAGQVYPSEVVQDMHRATSGWWPMPAALHAYVDGYRFISQHAANARFHDFLEAEVKNPNESVRDLQASWKVLEGD